MIPANSPEIIFAVLGAIIGVIFIVDGWRGSPKSGSFLQSPKVRALRAESAQLYPAAEMSDWIFYQEKSNLLGVGSGIPMRILL